MLHNTRRHLLSVSAATLLTGLGNRALAQELGIVKIICGSPPGGTSDTLCRRVAEGLRGSAFVKSALVENKGLDPGLSGELFRGDPTWLSGLTVLCASAALA